MIEALVVLVVAGVSLYLGYKIGLHRDREVTEKEVVAEVFRQLLANPDTRESARNILIDYNKGQNPTPLTGGYRIKNKKIEHV